MTNAKITVAVVGASGYGGAEIVRLLSSHPRAEVVTVTSERSAGQLLAQQCPWLRTDLVLTPFDPNSITADFTFLCQESGFAMERAAELMGKTRVIDLSADFRLDDHAVFEQYYKKPRAAASIGLPSVYGLPELVERCSIVGANLVANPGCYPTASLLGLMPLVKAGLVNGVPVIDAKSGVSGAGRSRSETDYTFSELSGGFKAYAVDGHRHTPEIEQMAGRPVRFTPHLIPAARGIHATLHVPVSSPVDASLFRDFYKGEPFVNVQETLPNTKQVQGSNTCAMSVTYDARTQMAVVCSVIDNLVKGAAGQAIQNMNLMAEIPETTGLPIHGVWP